MPPALRFLGFGMGVMNEAIRRDSTILWVGCPDSSSSQCRVGIANGELRIGRSKKGSDKIVPPRETM